MARQHMSEIAQSFVAGIVRPLVPAPSWFEHNLRDPRVMVRAADLVRHELVVSGLVSAGS
jgi:hypothetical protein